MASLYSYVLLLMIVLTFCFSFYKMVSQKDDYENVENLCMMTYMWRRMHFMDVGLKHSRYSLILYGEGHSAQKFAEKKYLDGIPLLFVHGNAGSGRQVRSLGSLLQNKTEQRKTSFHFDPFAVDFNEELTALDFDQIMSQSEFLLNAIDQIWALYKKKPPNGIILIGHSMGGIIIQTTLLNKEVDLNKIAFVLSFATPYAEAPFQFDKRFIAFWKQMHAANNPVKIISVSGGIKDEFIDESWTKASFLHTHSFTAAIDNVWLDMDHRCILWCNQLVSQTSRLLFDYALDPLYFLEQFGNITKRHYQSIGISFDSFNDDMNAYENSKEKSSSNTENMYKIVYMDNLNRQFSGYVLFAITKLLRRNAMPQLIINKKCTGPSGQTRYLDKTHFFAFLNLSDCAADSAVKVFKHAQFKILNENEILKTALHLDFKILFNSQNSIYSLSNTPFSVIPLVFKNGDFLIYRVRIETVNCRYEKSPQRIFFLENDQIRRVNEIRMIDTGYNNNMASILIYSSTDGNGSNAYKLIIVDARNCSEHILKISLDFRNSLIRILRRNRHILPAFLVLSLIFTSMLAYANSFIASTFPMTIAILLYFKSNSYDVIFILVVDIFLMSSFYFLLTCAIRPLLNGISKLDMCIEKINCYCLHLALMIFSIYSSQTSIMAIFFSFENIASLNKKYEHDITFASLSTLQFLQTSLQTPFLVTYFWKIIKYGEWKRSTFDPYFESNFAIMVTHFLNNFISMQSYSYFFYQYKFKMIFCSFFALLVFYRNYLCLFVLDDLTLLISLFLINFL